MNIMQPNAYLGSMSGYTPTSQAPSSSQDATPSLLKQTGGDTYAGSKNIFSKALDTSPYTPSGAQDATTPGAGKGRLLTTILPILSGVIGILGTLAQGAKSPTPYGSTPPAAAKDTATPPTTSVPSPYGGAATPPATTAKDTAAIPPAGITSPYGGATTPPATTAKDTAVAPPAGTTSPYGGATTPPATTAKDTAVAPPAGTGGGLSGIIASILQLLTSLLPMLMGNSQSTGNAGNSQNAGNANTPATGSQKATVTDTPPATAGPTPTDPNAPPATADQTPTDPNAPPTATPTDPKAPKVDPKATGGADQTPAGPASSVAPGGQLKVFGGSQSGENNISFNNASDKDTYVFVQKNLEKGEKDPGGTVFKIPKGSNISVSAVDDKGLRFQTYNGQLTPEQQAQMDKQGAVDGITVPGKTDTLYESNYVSQKHLSYDDISPLDGAKTAMKMSGNGGRTEEFSKEVIAGAPGKNADGSIPGVGPSASSTDNNAANPALRDYYAKTSLNADGTRAFYYNSSVGGDADKANVSYTGEKGKTRTTVTLQ